MLWSKLRFPWVILGALLSLPLATSAMSLAYSAHLSKGPSDLEQNGTQEMTKFSGPVFHGFSCGVVHFVPTVSFWNHQIESSYWLIEVF